MDQICKLHEQDEKSKKIFKDLQDPLGLLQETLNQQEQWDMLDLLGKIQQLLPKE